MWFFFQPTYPVSENIVTCNTQFGVGMSVKKTCFVVMVDNLQIHRRFEIFLKCSRAVLYLLEIKYYIIFYHIAPLHVN